jgi:hypothetical protein
VYSVWVEVVMKTVVDLDIELTQAAAAVLGTTTKHDTIHAALASGCGGGSALGRGIWLSTISSGRGPARW